MSLALVTGANGWLGSQLVKALINGLPEVNIKAEPGRKIRCLILPNSSSSYISMFNQIETYEGDIRDINAVKKFCHDANNATLFHCAGVIHPNKGIKELYEVNVTGTENILKVAEYTGVCRVIIVSSNSPIGINKNLDQVFNETSVYNPYMNYGRSKMLMEKLVHFYQEKGKLETVILRAPWFYGIGQPKRQTLFFSMIKNGKVPIIGNGNNLRSMTYIDNLCQGLLLCEQIKKANGQTYWSAHERPYTMNEIVDIIEELLEKEFNMAVAHKRIRLPNLAGEIATSLDWLLQFVGLYNQKIHVLSEMNKHIFCSIEKAKQELGYNPKIALREGMKRSIKWCLDNEHKI